MKSLQLYPTCSFIIRWGLCLTVFLSAYSQSSGNALSSYSGWLDSVPNDCPDPAIVEVYAEVSYQLYLNDFNQNKSAAIAFVQNQISLINDYYLPIKIQFHITKIVVRTSPDGFDSNEEDILIDAFIGHLGASYCADNEADVSILFVKEIDGFVEGSSNGGVTSTAKICEPGNLVQPVCVVEKMNNSDERVSVIVAHEMLHSFGLGHISSTSSHPCASECIEFPHPVHRYFVNRLLCEPNFLEIPEFTSCTVNRLTTITR